MKFSGPLPPLQKFERQQQERRETSKTRRGGSLDRKETRKKCLHEVDNRLKPTRKRKRVGTQTIPTLLLLFSAS